MAFSETKQTAQVKVKAELELWLYIFLVFWFLINLMPPHHSLAFFAFLLKLGYLKGHRLPKSSASRSSNRCRVRKEREEKKNPGVKLSPPLSGFKLPATHQSPGSVRMWALCQRLLVAARICQSVCTMIWPFCLFG